jgi:pSer/pThr/pTyr-binding forkhead associated (FHA) protein
MKTINIGRNPENEIIIQDPTVSRNHATLILNDYNYTIRDNSSSNGTFINGNRIYGEVQISRNDILKVGNALVPWMNYINNAEKPDDATILTIKSENETHQATVIPQHLTIVTLPHSSSSLILGILSIILTYGALIGLILGIIGLSNANKGLRLSQINPNLYESGSITQAKAGKVCSIIGIVFSSIVLLYWILILTVIANYY